MSICHARARSASATGPDRCYAIVTKPRVQVLFLAHPQIATAGASRRISLLRFQAEARQRHCFHRRLTSTVSWMYWRAAVPVNCGRVLFDSEFSPPRPLAARSHAYRPRPLARESDNKTSNEHQTSGNHQEDRPRGRFKEKCRDIRVLSPRLKNFRVAFSFSLLINARVAGKIRQRGLLIFSS